jgi:hypothetical protein
VQISFVSSLKNVTISSDIDTYKFGIGLDQSILTGKNWRWRKNLEEKILIWSYQLSTVYKLRPLLRPPSQLKVQFYFLPLANKHWLKWLFIIIQVRSQKNNIIRNWFSLNWPIKTGITVQWISTSNNFVLGKKSLTLSNS